MNIKNSNITIVDVKHLFCDKSKCKLNDKNNIFFHEAHPTLYGAKKINDVILKAIRDAKIVNLN